ncbi:hypothetical protein [Bartonella sp. B30(2025)]
MKKTTILLYGIGFIALIALSFLEIEKNTDFIQGVLTFASIFLVIVTILCAILCNSKLPSKLHFDPEYQYENTTSWNIITSDLHLYMHQLFRLIVLALVTLIFSYSPKTDISFLSAFGDEAHFSANTLLWHILLVFVVYVMARTYRLIDKLINLLRSCALDSA